MSPAVSWLYVGDDSTTTPHTHYVNLSRPNGYYLYYHINMKFYILPTEFVHVSVSFSQWNFFLYIINILVFVLDRTAFPVRKKWILLYNLG